MEGFFVERETVQFDPDVHRRERMHVLVFHGMHAHVEGRRACARDDEETGGGSEVRRSREQRPEVAHGRCAYLAPSGGALRDSTKAAMRRGVAHASRSMAAGEIWMWNVSDNAMISSTVRSESSRSCS